MAYLRRTAQLMGWSGPPLVLVVASWWGLRAAVGVAGGMLWALANAFALTWLVKETLGTQHPRRWKRIALWIVKLPVLYLVGAFLLLNPWSSPLGVVVGFSWWFVVLVAGALRGVTA